MNWNIPITATAEYPGITRIPPAVFQNRQWAPDPTGAHRWVHDMHDVNFGWTNGIVIENLIIDGTGFAGKLHALGMDSLAENCLFKNLWVIGFTGAGLWLTGNMTAPAFENSSIWICQEGAVKVTSSPYRWSLWQGGDHTITSGVLTTGEMFFKRMSGDSNDPSYFYITQPMNVCVVGLKYEDPTGLRHVALYDVDPTIVGTGSGVMAQGGRPSFLLQGGYAITNPGPPVGSSVFRIKITGSTDYREWPKPDITVLSFFNTHRNVMVDDGAQIWAHWGNLLPDGAIIGMDSLDPLTQYNPRAFFVYSNDSNSRVGIHTHDTRVSGTTLLVPGGGHFP